MRVAMVSRRVHPAHGPGGLERHVFDLVTELAAEGVEFDLYVETPQEEARRVAAEKAFPSTLTPKWVPPGPLPLGRRKGTVVLDRVTNYFIWSQRVAKQIMEVDTRPQIVHAHGLGGWGLARLSRRRRLGAPLVTTMQGLEEFRSHMRLKHMAYAPFRQGIRSIARHSTAIVTTDQALQPVVEQHLGVAPANQTVIPNAVDPDRCCQLGDVDSGHALLESRGLRQPSPLFLSVGRIEANKGFEVLVEALAKAAHRLPPTWAWLLVGDGPERVAVQRAIEGAGIGARCVLFGRATEAELHSLYAAASWFVHPTLYEGSSLVALEAMAHGLPVLASRTGGLPDKVVHGVSGFLVAPGNSDELAERLVNSIEVDRDAFGEAGRRRCEARFSWRVVRRQYLELYQRLSAA